MSLPTFIDVFSGCGGLSLGMMSAGWKGKFAIEKNPDAFATIQYNLIGHENNQFNFDWPNWLAQQPMTSNELICGHKEKLSGLRGKVDMIVGGPPCQGFSLAGRRNPADPRNTLTEEYLQIVKEVRPRFLLIENVQGFTIPFKNSLKQSGQPYSNLVKQKLEGLGYVVFNNILNSSDFGVPQNRKRFIMLAIQKNDPAMVYLKGKDPLKIIVDRSKSFKGRKGLSIEQPHSAGEALSDLEIQDRPLIPCFDSSVKGYMQLNYEETTSKSAYQDLMRQGLRGTTNSLRLARHCEQVERQFLEIQIKFPQGKSLSKEARDSLGLKKRSITALHPDMPSPTITTLPDDILHYSEPRILTVRESARLQSFPDWYQFQGKYTTGGKKRKLECPRYTQVGNAVPPLMAEAIGEFIFELSQING